MFVEWVKSLPFKTYISGYNQPFNLVKEFKHRITLGAATNKDVIERLYCNQVEEFNFI